MEWLQNNHNHVNVITVIRCVDKVSQYLACLSVALLFWEFQFNAQHSLDSTVKFFLYAERTIASFFIAEYIFRLYEDYKHPELTPDIGFGTRYTTSFIGLIDLMAWLPFVVGFFLPIQYLGLVRALRVLRLFKLFRYNVELKLIAGAALKSWQYIKPLIYTLCILILFNAVLIHQLEKDAQPETFGRITNCLWFCIVSASTVGYGDMSPHTDAGKFFTAIFNFLPAIFVFSGMVGVAGGMFTKVIEEYKNADV